VSGLRVLSFVGGTAVLSWNGGPASYVTPGGVAESNGYNLYMESGSRWVVLRVGVYPPLTVARLTQGTVLGIAPTYVLPSGREIAGGIAAVKVG